MADISSVEAAIARHRAWVDRYVGPWFGSLLLFALLRGILEKAASLHWAVGLFATLALATCLAFLLVGWKRKLYLRYSATHTRFDAATMMLSTLLIAVAVFASVSMLIFQFDPQSYTGSSAVSMGTLTDYYAWLTLDSIPVVQFADTFHVPRPLEHHGALAAMCLLVFRVLVLSTLLSAVSDWFGTPAAAAERQAEAKSM